MTIWTVTNIPLQGEQLVKGMPCDIDNYKHLFKPKYKNKGYGAIVPREYPLEPYKELLKVIMRNVTCEGRFGRIY